MLKKPNYTRHVRNYSTRTLVRILNQDGAEYTVPDVSPKYLKTVPNLNVGDKFQYFKQTIANIDGEILVGQPMPYRKPQVYKE